VGLQLVEEVLDRWTAQQLGPRRRVVAATQAKLLQEADGPDRTQGPSQGRHPRFPQFMSGFLADFHDASSKTH
jgi:hypothetical protein